nr:putative lipoprotein precursor [uncultured bacterium]
MLSMRANSFRLGLAFICLFISLFTSCSEKRTLSEEELRLYVQNPENGLISKVEKNGALVELSYRPKELIIAQEVGYADPIKWEGEEKRLDSVEYFILRLSKNGDEIENGYVSEPEKYNTILNYLNGPVSGDLRLYVSNRVVKAESAIFVPSFGSGTATSVMVLFRQNLAEIDESFSVVYDDSILGLGRCEFSFAADAIKNIPKLIRN